METMKRRPFSELTKHWPPERTARVEAMVDTALAELEPQERAPASDEVPSEATGVPPRPTQQAVREHP